MQDAGLVHSPPATVDHLQRPAALRLLAPEVHAEEGPVVEVGLGDVPWPLKQQRARRAHRRGQQDAQVAAREEAQRNLALHVLEEAHLVRRTRTPVHVHVVLQRVPVGALNLVVLGDLPALADVLHRHIRPLLGQADHRSRVHQAIAELVADLLLHPVQNPSPLLLEGLGARREDHQVLHVTPRQRGVRLQRQSADSSGQRGRCGRACVLDRTDPVGTQLTVHVDSGHALVMAGCARAVGGRQRGAAFLQIPRLVTVGRRVRGERAREGFRLGMRSSAEEP